jgi:hypothetical protein
LRRARAFEAIVLDGAGPVGAKVGVLDFADGTGSQERDGRAVTSHRGHLRAELRDNALLHRRFRERADFGDVVAHRFLAIDVFALLDRGIGDGEVHVIRHGHVGGEQTADDSSGTRAEAACAQNFSDSSVPRALRTVPG